MSKMKGIYGDIREEIDNGFREPLGYVDYTSPVQIPNNRNTTRSEYSATQLARLMANAQRGSESAITRLVGYANERGRITNQRMRSLEKAGYDFYDYDYAKVVLDSMGRKRFREKWTEQAAKENIDDFLATIKAERRFIDKGSSTVSEIRERSSKRLNFMLDNILEKAYGKQFESVRNPNTPEEREIRRKLERAIASGSLSDLFSEGYGNTGESFEAVYYAFQHGASVEEVEQRIETLIPKLQSLNYNVTIQDIINRIASAGER